MLLLAHRGASARAPENTLPAFRLAVEEGADGVELDVMRCGSGELVVCHDERLDRLAGLGWEVARTRWSKLQQADVGTRLGFAPARIPLLEEVFEALPPHFLVNVEIKCDALDDRGLALEVGAFLVRHQLEGRVLCSSFNAVSLIQLGRAFPSLRRGYLVDPDRSLGWQERAVLPTLHAFSVHPHWRTCSAERIAAWHQQGLKVATWTVNSPEDAKDVYFQGADYLISDRVGALRAALSSA